MGRDDTSLRREWQTRGRTIVLAVVGPFRRTDNPGRPAVQLMRSRSRRTLEVAA